MPPKTICKVSISLEDWSRAYLNKKQRFLHDLYGMDFKRGSASDPFSIYIYLKNGKSHKKACSSISSTRMT